MTNAILEFQKENRWLSNFWPCRCFLYGYEFRATENAYQFGKLPHGHSDYHNLALLFKEMTPAASKKEIKLITGPYTSEEVAVRIMGELLYQKFDRHINPELHQKLKDTGDAHLSEGNWWHDTFWGVDLKTGVGENTLGKLLMEVRASL